MTPWIGAALVAAAAGAPHCLGMCGPFACAAGGRPAAQAAYHLGRISTYAALGALSGALGWSVPGPAWVGGALAAALLVGFSLVLADVLPEPRWQVPGLARLGALAAREESLAWRWVLGAVNGLLPCGLVWATLALSVATADPLRGAAVMLAFGLGTVPVLAAATLGLRRLLQGSRRARRALAAVVLVSGLTSLALRTGLAGAVGLAETAEGEAPPCHQE